MCEQMFRGLDGDSQDWCSCDGAQRALQGKKLAARCPTGSALPRAGWLLALCLEMFSGDQRSPDRPRLVDGGSLILWGGECRGVSVPRAAVHLQEVLR